MTATLAEALPQEIERVRHIQDLFKGLRRMPNVIVEPQIAAMERDLQAAITAMAEHDAVAMLRAYAALKEWKE